MDRIATGPGPILTHLEQNDNTRTGATCLAEFEGSAAECQLKKQWLVSLGASDTDIHDLGNGFWRVRALFPFGFNGQVTDFGLVPSVHELDTCIAQVSVYRSKKLRTLLTPPQIGIVQRVITDYQSGLYPKTSGHTAAQDAEADVSSLVTADGTPTTGRTITQACTDATNLFRSVAYLGVEDGIEFYTVYKRTLTAATPQQVKASFEGVGKIWTTAEVQSFEGIMPDGWFTLDANAQWLKAKPQVLAAAGQKTQVIYSYTECLVALGLIYDAYGSATLLYPPAA